MIGAHREIEGELREVEERLSQLERELVVDPTKRAALEEAREKHAALIEQLPCLDFVI